MGVLRTYYYQIAQSRSYLCTLGPQVGTIYILGALLLGNPYEAWAQEPTGAQGLDGMTGPVATEPGRDTEEAYICIYIYIYIHIYIYIYIHIYVYIYIYWKELPISFEMDVKYTLLQLYCRSIFKLPEIAKAPAIPGTPACTSMSGVPVCGSLFGIASM